MLATYVKPTRMETTVDGYEFELKKDGKYEVMLYNGEFWVVVYDGWYTHPLCTVESSYYKNNFYVEG